MPREPKDADGSVIRAILFGGCYLTCGGFLVWANNGVGENGQPIPSNNWPYLWILLAVLILGTAARLAAKEFRRRRKTKL